MIWWTQIQGVVTKHDGRKPKLGAAIEVTFAKARGVPLEDLGLYRKDPEKHPDAINKLPALLAKAQKGRRK